MIFDYKALLRLDDETYTAWSPTLKEYEDDAINTAKSLNPNVTVSAGNEILERYCKRVVFMNVYGDGLSARLFEFHSAKIADYEERFRYGGGEQ